MPANNNHPPGSHGSRAGTVTQVLWGNVTGLQLEELLYGLLDAMGASSLTWRAGSVTGVTAADGGRDLEAVFDRPSPDGELDRQRWWIECKGRSETVERNAVQQAALDASARPDVDILIVATNSRFSNPTRDWVAERTRSFTRPVIKLWDRDKLDRLVRQYPTVVARVLPDALPDEDRLLLLVTRFEELGEEPTLLDLEFFWERQDWLREREPKLLSRAIAMLLYTEGVPLPRKRQWWRLLQIGDAPNALITALIWLPNLLYSEPPLARPLEMIRAWAAASRLLVSCLLLLPDDAGLALTLNPWHFVIDGGKTGENQEQLAAWRHDVLTPVLAFMQSELLGPCSADCDRVIGTSPHEAESLGTTEFWQMLCGMESESKEGTIVMESTYGRCTVGLNMTSGCPLIVSNELSCEKSVKGIQAILKFRQDNPDDAAQKIKDEVGGGRLTILYEHGLAYKTIRFAAKADRSEN